MIPKSCRLLGQDNTTKQTIRAKWRFDLILFRSGPFSRPQPGRIRTEALGLAVIRPKCCANAPVGIFPELCAPTGFCCRPLLRMVRIWCGVAGGVLTG